MLQKYLMIPGRNCIFLCKAIEVGPDGHGLILMTMLLNEIKKTTQENFDTWRRSRRVKRKQRR
jgi:hypothetical protein